MGKICYDCATEKVNGVCPNCYPDELKEKTEMTREEQDEKEFKQWVNSDDSQLFVICGNYNQSLFVWLASRRLLREQLGKWHDVEEFYKEAKDE